MIEVSIINKDGKEEKTVKAMIDTGAQISLIDSELVNEVKWDVEKTSMGISGVEGPDRLVMAAGACYGIIELEDPKVLIVQTLYIMPRMNVKLLFGNDFIKLLQICLKTHPDGTYSIIKDNKNIRRCLLTLISIGKIGKWQKTKMKVGDGTKIDKLNKQAEMSFNDLNNNVKEVVRRGISSSLTPNQRNQLYQILLKYQNVFATHKYDLGRVPADIAKVSIDIGDNHIPCCKPYRMGEVKRKEMNKIINEMKLYNIIEESDAAGGAPALLVQKPDKSWRLVINYIELNKICKKRCYPMPNVDDYITALRGYSYYTILDLAHGYFQIELGKDEREKTAFVTEDGKYQFKRLPMELVDAPFYFQKLMNKVMGDMKYSICLGYFGDIPIMRTTFEDLVKNMEAIFERLIKFNLKCRPDKCRFGIRQLKFLGHIVSGEGLRPDPDKVAVLKKLKPPKSLKQLQSHLGCYNYFSRYIKDFAKIAAPLYQKIKKNIPFEFTEDDLNNWERLRNSLIEDCLLVHFDPRKDIKLMVDASNAAVGGVLLQFENEWRPISYFGHKLLKYQLSYTVTEKECLAVVIGVCKYRHYLEGKEFIIVSDHHALCSLKKTNPRLARLHRWAVLLSIFRYKIVYSKGKEHPLDCLSRAEGLEMSPLTDDQAFDCLMVRKKRGEKLTIRGSVKKEYSENITELVAKKGIVRYGLNEKGIKNHRVANLLTVVMTMSINPSAEIRKLQEEDTLCQYIMAGLKVEKNKVLERKFELVQDVIYRKPTKRNQN